MKIIAFNGVISFSKEEYLFNDSENRNIYIKNISGYYDREKLSSNMDAYIGQFLGQVGQ